MKEAYVSYEIAKLLKEKGFDVKPYYQYYISSCGKVFGCKGEQMKTQISNRGYERIWLTINGKRERHSVHRLVALNFVPNPEKKLEVNHIDGNKLNNNASNLEWCTRSENEQHAWKNGLKTNLVKGKFGKDHVASRPFICIETGKIYYCQRELAEELGGGMDGVSHLTRACRFGYLDHGYHWRYYEPNELVKLLFEKGYTKYPMSYDGDYWFCYIQMAMAWLREVHNIFILIGWNPIQKEYFTRIINMTDGCPKRNIHEYTDYNEAIESSLKYILEKMI